MIDVRGLTLSPPWHIAILDYGKRLENRKQRWGWKGVLLLHVAKSVNPEYALAGREWIERAVGGRMYDDVAVSKEARGKVVGVCRVVGAVSDPEEAKNATDGMQVALWWMGPHALVLEAVETLSEPVPYPGALGLWRVPSGLAATVSARLPRLSHHHAALEEFLIRSPA